MSDSRPETNEIDISCTMVVGLGLIGGSIAMALHDARPSMKVVGVAPRADTLKAALDGSVIDEGIEASDPAFEEMLAGRVANVEVGLVVLAMPPAFARGYLERIERSGYRGIITDTVSTKTEICDIAEEALSDPSRFIPGHPMAGREVNGLTGAMHGLFSGRYWILCPDSRTDHASFLALHSLVVAMGAKCISLPREDHDSMVAVISHVPHMTASALVELAGRRAAGSDELLRLAAGGFKDSTRVAAGSPALWEDIAMSNREQIADGLHELGSIISNIESMVREGDSDGLLKFLTRTSELRRKIPAAWIPSSEKLLALRVSMENHPGAVASVTSIAGRFGCNIQSIDIDHLSDSSAILELVLTDEGDMDGMLEALGQEGFEVSKEGYAEVRS